MLPDGDGFALCREIRKKHTYPIILLTSKTEGADRVTGLSLGADDYVTKPFLPIELVARVKAHLRRVHDYDGKENGSNEIVTIAGLLLNKKTNILPRKSFMHIFCCTVMITGHRIKRITEPWLTGLESHQPQSTRYGNPMQKAGLKRHYIEKHAFHLTILSSDFP